MYRNSYNPSTPSNPPPPPPPGYDNYNRPPQPSWNGYPPQERRDDYQFRGPYSDLRRNRPDDHRRSDGEYRDRDRDRYRDSDNYRPPQGDFTFRVERPAGIDSYVPSDREQRDSRDYGDGRNAPHQPRRDDNGRSAGRDGRPRRNDDRRRHQPHRDARYRGQARQYNPYKPPIPAARLLLMKKHDDNPEIMLGDTTGRATYRDVDELSDSDEAEMDISDNSDSDVAEPVAKRMRTSESTTKPEQDVPRWSNPDPYTALPPPDESTRKKKDMVQLIRKARVEAEAKKPTAPAEGLDFISCDFSDNEDEKNKATADNEDSANGKSQLLTDKSDANRREATSTLPATQSHNPPTEEIRAQRTEAQPTKPSTQGTSTNPIDLTASTSLGTRKRTFDDTIKLPHSTVKVSMKFSGGGNVLPAWQPKDDNPCPWVVADHSTTPSMATRLHKEIVDFYLYVRPRNFEERVRNELLNKLRTVVKRKWADAEVYPFGSFMSGLYLPTADMDVAICSNSFINRNIPRYDKKKDLWAFKAHLIHHGVPYQNDVEVIAKAKVPLVKFADRETGLKVDISFEKIDGYRAIKTFLDWKEKYPVMPILVAVIKHFLLMRGLNEPVNGGIGGFSVICMVVNLLNQMPQVQSRSMKPEHHLGELLMEFFDYYGNHFQYNTVAIRMNPPGLVPKSKVSNVIYRNLDRLSILDPNNPDNDIAGGSKNTPTILAQFSKAHSMLRARMVELARGTKTLSFGNTILGPLFAGNYSIFQVQRDYLERLAAQGIPNYQPQDYNSGDVVW
ncbi:hypothetical protein K445DRAFT_318962 [Daldinia sp. EC12]|nr:hypothetical protein F4774DRAFT_372083 [Daldinia eschscholtzii]OTB14545.1 hypothetical protein K445DRAFT_318962 [Daldinia sp. EC12]